ncbi:MAG: hypothetical protein KDK70_38640, partial [Myxococcales bacterium]|nr:hypothetical protein [Myxococcales bacterium]
MLRLGAIAIVLLPLAGGVILRGQAWGVWGVWGVWLGVALAGLVAVAITIAQPRARSLVLLGTMLAVLAGLAASQLGPAGSEPVVIDLRHEPLPPGLRGPAAVTGFFREEWVLAEYAVPEGALPQQDESAAAQLVPFLGVEDGPAPLRDVVLVARVRPGQEQTGGVQTIHG